MATWDDLLDSQGGGGLTDPKPDIPWYTDFAGSIVASKLAAMGLTAAGVGTGGIGLLPAVVGGGLWGLGKGLYEGKGIIDSTAGEAIRQGGWQLAGHALGKLWKPLSAAAKPLYQEVKKHSLGDLIKSGDERWEAIKPLRDAVSGIEVFKKGGFLSGIAGGSTIEQLLIPGVEKIPKMGIMDLTREFAKEQNIRGKVADTAKALNAGISGLSIEERAALGEVYESGVKSFKLPSTDPNRNMNVFETIAKPLNPSKAADWETRMSGYSGYAGLSQESKDKVITALQPLHGLSTHFDNVLNTTKANYLKAEFSEKFVSILEKETFGDSATAIGYANLFKQGISGYSLQKATREAIKAAAENPNVSLVEKNTLKFIHDIPAIGSEATYGAGMSAARENLFEQIKKYRAYTTNDPAMAAQKGFVKVKGPAGDDFKGLFLEPNTAKAVEEISDVPSHSRDMWNKYFFSPWKLWRVIGRPASQFRNAFGNFIQNDMYGAHPLSPLNMPVYAKAFKDLKSFGPESQELAKTTGLSYGGFVGAEFSNIAGSLRHDNNMYDVMLGYSAKVAEPFTKTHNFFESWAKVAKYIHNKDMGMEKWDAAIDAVRSTFNYGEVTHFTKVMRESVMPFGTWQLKTLRSLPEAMVKHPLRFAKYVAMPAALTSYALSNLNVSEDEWQKFKGDLPGYMQNKMFFLLPGRDERGRLQMFDLTWWLPGIGDLVDMQKDVKAPLGIIQNPVINLTAELTTNKRNNGAPIWYEWMDGSTKLAKATHHIYQNLMPTWLPGGTDWMQVQNAAMEKPNSLTLAQSLASTVFGLKTMPFEEGETAMKKARLQETFKRELIGQMKKDLALSRTDKDREKTMIKYQSWLQNIYSRPTPEE
jgi:hypothetical protein